MDNIAFYREAEITADLDTQLRALLCTCFPGSRETFETTRHWNGCVPLRTLVIPGENGPAASLALIDRAVLVGDHQLRVAGIGNVCVHPDARGNRYGGTLVKAAMAFALQRDFDCGLLFTSETLDAMYTSYDWHRLHPRPIIRTDAAGNNVRVHADTAAMFHPLALPAFPEGTVHLQGDMW